MCFCAFGRDLRRAHRLPVIAPRPAFVIDDGGDLGIIQRCREWRHGTAVNHTAHSRIVYAAQYSLDMRRRVIVIHDVIPLQRGKRTGQSFAVRLVTG